jgi:Myb/SANT-like DNA-binding domain
MAAPVINPNHIDTNNLREWPLDATEGLIRRRFYYKEEFFARRVRDQAELWVRISNHIYNTYFINVTAAQCRQKWNSLVYGYENLKRLNNDNPDGFRTYCPSYYDRFFYHEMSGEFWINPSNYLFI